MEFSIVSMHIQKYNGDITLCTQTNLNGIHITSPTPFYLQNKHIIDHFPLEISEKIFSELPPDMLHINDYVSKFGITLEKKTNELLDQTISDNDENKYDEYDSDFELYNPVDEDEDIEEDTWYKDYTCDKYGN